MKFEEWLSIGVSEGWVTLPICGTHTGAPMRDWEEEAFDYGADPCIFVMRVWHDGMEDFEP